MEPEIANNGGRQMTLTVEDVLTFGGLQDAWVAAGTNGLQQTVESISVLEVVEPEIAAWMLSGQLYITSFYAVRSDIPTQLSVIEALHHAGGCGLVICHIDRWVRKLASEIIALCDRLAFPLIIANPSTSYVEILNPVIERLMHIVDSDSRFFLSTQNRLIDLVANEKHLDNIFRKIAALFQHEILFFDLNNQCIYTNALTDSTLARQIENYLRTHHADINIETRDQDSAFRDIGGKPKMIYPIRSADMFYGYVIVDSDELQALSAQKIIKNIAKICTLIYTRKNRVNEMSEFYVQDFIRNLINWHFADEEAALSAAEQVGIDISGQLSVMIINIVDHPNQHKTIQALQVLQPQIAQTVKQSHSKNMALLNGDDCLILLHTPDKSDPEQTNTLIGRKIQQLCQQSLSTPFSIGISTPIDQIHDFSKAYKEALDATQTGRRFIGENQIIHYASLGFLSMISDLQTQPHMLEIATELLRPLREYDIKNNARLCKTLAAILRCNMDVGLTAKELYLHKNTVLYRKNKIIDILGINPFVMPYLLNFIMATTLIEE